MTEEHFDTFVSTYDFWFMSKPILEKEEERKILDFFECCFLDFYKAELKSEDRFIVRTYYFFTFGFV